MSTVAEKLIKLRSESGLSQRKFAEMIGVSHPSLAKFEGGETDIIPLGVAKKIAYQFSVSFDEFFCIDNHDLKILNNTLESMQKSYDKLWSDYEKRGEFIDTLLSQLKNVRTHLVDIIVDKHSDNLYDLWDFEKPNEWNFNNLSGKAGEDKDLREILILYRAEIKWFIRNGLITNDDYEGNLQMRKENGLLWFDILKVNID